MSSVPPNSIAAGKVPEPFEIRAIYHDHASFLGRVIHRLTGPGEHVDDLLQETFLVAHRRRGEFEGRSQVRTWLYAIAAHLCMRHNRGVRRLFRFRERLALEMRGDASSAGPLPDDEAQRLQAIALVHEVLQRMPFKLREVFSLFELEGLDGAQIAEVTAIPLGTVWTRLKTAREMFRELMRRRLKLTREEA